MVDVAGAGRIRVRDSADGALPPRFAVDESDGFPMKKTVSRKTLCKQLETRLDTLWAEAVKKRDHHKCRYCGQGKPHVILNAHHIESRRHKSTRFDTLNGITLCSGHHEFFAHNRNNSAFWLWLQGEIGLPTIQWLRTRASEVQHVTYAWLQDMEQELLKEAK